MITQRPVWSPLLVYSVLEAVPLITGEVVSVAAARLARSIEVGSLVGVFRKEEDRRDSCPLEGVHSADGSEQAAKKDNERNWCDIAINTVNKLERTLSKTVVRARYSAMTYTEILTIQDLWEKYGKKSARTNC